MSETEQAPEPEIIGPGEILKKAREAKGVTLEDMAAKLHLKSVAIANLEADDYDESISLTFTKGYLKLYAKHIGVDEGEVLSAFEKQNTKNKEPAKLQSFSRRVANQASDDRLMFVTYLVVAAVIALVVVWWWQQSTTETASLSNSAIAPTEITTTDLQEEAPQEPEQQPSTDLFLAQSSASEEETSPALETPTAAYDSNTADQLATDVIDTADELAQAAEQRQPEDDLIVADAALTDTQTDSELPTEVAAVSLANDELPAEEVQLIELVFTFSDDCWMNLTDATGEAIAYGVKKSGRVMTVEGVPPFEVTLGAPAVVQISYDGSDVDMSQFDAGRTARFSLPFSG